MEADAATNELESVARDADVKDTALDSESTALDVNTKLLDIPSIAFDDAMYAVCVAAPIFSGVTLDS